MWDRIAARTLLVLTAPLLIVLAPAAAAQQPSPREARVCAHRDPLRSPFFGDLHVHTVLSLDASTQGTRTRPDEAYRYARGESIGIQPFREDGTPMRTTRLARPLDFAAVTDHAELLGEANTCSSPDLPGYDSWVCWVYRNYPRVAFFYMNFQASRAVRHNFCGPDGSLCLQAARPPWEEILRAAEKHYDRGDACAFTTFPAYEWTGAIGTGNNFHRNVIFRNESVPALPISFIDAPELPDFWNRLGESCLDAGKGCDVIVIPHNSNLGAGLMFQTVDEDGGPMTAEQAQLRQRYERLVEVMQHKGDSECHPGFSNEDELCGFEKLSFSSFRAQFMPMLDTEPNARMYIRRVLQEGLLLQRELGTNPFRFGIIASTDTHLGTPGLVAETADFPGHGGAGKPTEGVLPRGLPDMLDFNPGGLAVLWAEQNTRDSLFDAMQRREVYGTSGPRIVVRFFGAWQLPDDLCERGDLVRTGYQSGVPMGGTLVASAAGAAPEFVVSALRDPGVAGSPGTPLQRIQIVKGWTEGDSVYERVFDVAGDPDNGASVDPLTCAPTGAGADALCRVWRDPDFDPEEHAFYYARVVENPVCRWSQQLCVSRGIRCEDPTTMVEGFEECCSPTHRKLLQERAWTSPIWVEPAAAHAHRGAP